MKSPICEICLKSDLLCPACQGKVERGEVTQTDIKILSLLHKESEKNKDLENIEIKKIVDCQDVILIICSKREAAKIVGKGGFFVKKIQDIVNKPVRIVEESGSLREFIQNIILPVPIIGLNTLYTAKGEKYKIIIPKNSRLPLKLKTFSNLAKDVLKKDVEIDFE